MLRSGWSQFKYTTDQSYDVCVLLPMSGLDRQIRKTFAELTLLIQLTSVAWDPHSVGTTTVKSFQRRNQLCLG